MELVRRPPPCQVLGEEGGISKVAPTLPGTRGKKVELVRWPPPCQVLGEEGGISKVAPTLPGTGGKKKRLYEDPHNLDCFTT